MSETPWRATLDGVVIACRLTPKGGRDAIDGVATLSDGMRVLLVRVRSAPEDGKANEALCRLIASKSRRRGVEGAARRGSEEPGEAGGGDGGAGGAGGEAERTDARRAIFRREVLISIACDAVFRRVVARPS